YAGAQVGGLDTYPDIVRLLDEVERETRECPTPEARRQAWCELLTFQNQRAVQVAPSHGLYLKPGAMVERSGGARAREWAWFRIMDVIDHLLFKEGAAGARMLAPVLRRL